MWPECLSLALKAYALFEDFNKCKKFIDDFLDEKSPFWGKFSKPAIFFIAFLLGGGVVYYVKGLTKISLVVDNNPDGGSVRSLASKDCPKFSPVKLYIKQ